MPSLARKCYVSKGTTAQLMEEHPLHAKGILGSEKGLVILHNFMLFVTDGKH